jgi:ubiquinone/menaquinone biosynthesis C-methylase UbiE
MQLDHHYYLRPAAAFVRGTLGDTASDRSQAGLFVRPLDELAPEEMAVLIDIGREHGLRLHAFKNTMGLARVRKVLGILKGVQPRHLLDIGSGRGAFLWPLLHEFPRLPITAIDTRADRVAALRAVRAGGIDSLTACQMDVTALPFDDDRFEVVTMLEVLEHIPNTTMSLAEVCRVARSRLILSVPSRPDDNPEHLHLFTEDALRAHLARQGIRRVQFEHVLNHLIAVARIER